LTQLVVTFRLSLEVSDVLAIDESSSLEIWWQLTPPPFASVAPTPID
jgi:hypothetical protein